MQSPKFTYLQALPAVSSGHLNILDKQEKWGNRGQIFKYSSRKAGDFKKA